MKKRRRFSQWFKDLKLSKKIFYTFVSSALIPLVAVQGIMLYIISDNMRKKGDEMMHTQLMQTAERTSLSLEIYTNLVYQIYSDNQIIEAVNKYRTAAEGKESIRREISTRFQQYGISVSGISCISIIFEDGDEISYDFIRASVVDNLWGKYEDIREIEPYKKARYANNMVISPTERFLRGTHEERMFHIAKRMYDFNRIEEGSIGTIVMSIDEEVLNRICAMNQSSDNNETYAVNFIMDEKNNVITYPDSFYSGIRVRQDIEKFVKITGKLKDKKIAVNKYVDKNLGWVFYNVYDEDYMLRDIKKTQLLTLILGIAIIGIAFVLVRYTVKLIEQFTHSIIRGIQEVQRGNLDVQVEVYGEDEMGQIANNFNTMTNKVKNLIREVEEVTERKKEAEITALEAQINPHFLYNTLDSINWMAIEKQEYELSRMLCNLGSILRYSVSRSNKMTTIQEMADWLDKYISLQKMRFNDAFCYEINVEKGTERFVIHKLLLQPFIENAIIHGFKGIVSGGMLRVDITLSEDEEELYLIVEDNGKGMPKEKADEFNRPDIRKEDGKSIGMHNAFARMYMYYGERAFWKVSSMEDMGTVITLKIPADRGENAR